MIKIYKSGWRKLRRMAGLSVALLALFMSGCQSPASSKSETELSVRPDFPIRVSDNHRYFVDQKGQPFFWLGDTGWLLLSKLRQDEVDIYLKDRHEKGFNVIQVMVIHDLGEKNADGRQALIDNDLSRPDTASGTQAGALSYWQGLDSLVVKAGRLDMLVALVPVWGSVVKSGKVSMRQAAAYARFLASRYHDAENVVWLNGGDVLGTDYTEIWETIGRTIKAENPAQLMTFHPRGRTQSSEWFHNASWLDFNCFQSGHRRYDQDNEPGTLQYGEDNYKYVQADYRKKPAKPTLDAEPSYEGIPQGLHDSLQPRWDAAAIRRYAYWSVFSGACGFTYGANAVMQFYDPSTGLGGAYGVTKGWKAALQDTAAGQLIYLKKLMLGKPYLTRVPDSAAVLDQGSRYDYVAATSGPGYRLFYTPDGRDFQVDLSGFDARKGKIQVSWFNPRNGQTGKPASIGVAKKYSANPPGEKGHGNDWVLIIDQRS